MEAHHVARAPRHAAHVSRSAAEHTDRSATPRPQTSYRVGAAGIEISDRRQLTHGAIVPNYVVDLVLPIIGYDGLGVLTLLYRLANADQRVLTNLDAFARAGRMGFRRFSQLLNLLDELAIITVQRPSGAARLRHYRTVIALLDPPRALPASLTSVVLDRTLTPWLLTTDAPSQPSHPDGPNREPSGTRLSPTRCEADADLSDTSSTNGQGAGTELLADRPTECTRQMHEPMGNEPTEESNGRAGSAAPDGAGVSLVDPPAAHQQRPPAPDRPSSSVLDDYWKQHAARPRPSDTERLRTLSDTYGHQWVIAAITSLGARAPIYKLDAVQVTLARWQREASWGSPAPRRNRAGTPPRVTPLDHHDPRRSHPVVARFIAAFGHVPSTDQADAMIATVCDTAAWAQILGAWRLNGHRPQNVAGLLDRYAQRLSDHQTRSKTAQTHRAVAAPGVGPDTASLPMEHEPLRCTWERVLEAVATQLAGDEVDAWLRPAGLIHIDEAEATIAAGNVFARDSLQTHYQPLLEAAFAAELGRPVAVQVVIC